VAPILGLTLNSFTAAAVSLSLWGGANCAEIVRGGLQAVPRGQREASRALALPKVVGFCKVILPQALRPIIPALAGMFTLLVQSTALGALVGVPELFRNGGIVVERAVIAQGSSPAFAVYGAVLLTYFVVCSLLTRMTRGLERHYDPQHRGRQARVVLESVRQAV
jgi:polar amino acid transport system permease protein